MKKATGLGGTVLSGKKPDGPAPTQRPTSGGTGDVEALELGPEMLISGAFIDSLSLAWKEINLQAVLNLIWGPVAQALEMTLETEGRDVARLADLAVIVAWAARVRINGLAPTNDEITRYVLRAVELVWGE